MPKSSRLSSEEKAVIDALRARGVPVPEIALQIARDPSTIYNYINRRDNPRPPGVIGRPRLLSERDDRHVAREAVSTNHTCRQIIANQGLAVSTRTVLRSIHRAGDITWGPTYPGPNMTKEHIRRRRGWCEQHKDWTDDWRSVVFSDEKQFCLDGPHGLHLKWRKKGADNNLCAHRPQGGGSVQVWGAIGYNGLSKLAFVEGTMNSMKYINTLHGALLPVVDDMAVGEPYFQQDNSSVHNSHLTATWLTRNLDWIDDWPAHSPDLNIIENLWGFLSSRVYANFRQYRTTEELKKAILQAWNAITLDYIHALYDSLPERIKNVIKARGKFTNLY